MLQFLKDELKRVGPKHISRTVKSNRDLLDFVVSKTNHIDAKNISEQIYFLINEFETKPKCYCSNDLKFESLNKGYTEYCSTKCARNSTKTKKSFSEKIINRTASDRKEILDKRKKTNIEKYGLDNVSKLESVKEKKKSTLKQNYGVESPLQSDEIREKVKQTNLGKYSHEYYLSSEDAKKKIKQTNLSRYGVENPMQNENIKNKSVSKQVEQYGGIGFQVDKEQLKDLDWDKIREKVKKTNISRYGAENPFESDVIKEKIKQTNLEKYGAENPFESDVIKEKIKQTNLEKYGVENPSKNEQVIKRLKKTQKETFFEKIKRRLDGIVKPLFSVGEYNGVLYDNIYDWECCVCNTTFASNIDNGAIPICPHCFPRNNGISQLENTLFDYIKSDDKVQSDRKILDGKELDILLPYKKLAIEFNGLYWHSELNGKDKNYHLNKSKHCNGKGIQLIHVFENEWLENQNIVKSIINSKLGQYETRIFARQCKIKEITTKEKNKFLEENHIQGQDKSTIRIGLFHDTYLVSVMTFGKSRYNKKYQWEMHRFCNKLNHQIVGGASKLWTYFLRNYNPESVITYADRRYSDGTFYEKIGFNKIGESKPNYFYFKGNSGLMSRLHFQKHKLKDKLDKFNPELTEWENMQLNGYDRIWDCGNYVFEWKNK